MPAGSRPLCVCLLALAACLESPPTADDVASPDASGQARAWSLRETEPTPPPLFGPRLAYDHRDGVVLLYGGSMNIDNSGAVGSLLAWDGTSWTVLCDPCPPGPRLHHGFAYDVARRRAVLYGGVDDSGQLRGDVWEWDGLAWIDQGEAGPPARSHMWMSYDPTRERVVVFGGESDIGPTNDVMEYDGENWYIAGSGEAPTPRRDAGGNASAFDPARERLLFYGDDALGDELWAWDGVDWTRLCEDCTGVPRNGAMLEVDAARERILIIAGWDPSVEVVGTWELDLEGNPACEMRAPTQRDTGGVARDPVRDVFVLYGGNGNGCGGNCDQTLELAFAESGDCAE